MRARSSDKTIIMRVDRTLFTKVVEQEKNYLADKEGLNISDAQATHRIAKKLLGMPDNNNKRGFRLL